MEYHRVAFVPVWNFVIFASGVHKSVIRIVQDAIDLERGIQSCTSRIGDYFEADRDELAIVLVLAVVLVGVLVEAADGPAAAGQRPYSKSYLKSARLCLRSPQSLPFP
jgi:hypothetical protein